MANPPPSRTTACGDYAPARFRLSSTGAGAEGVGPAQLFGLDLQQIDGGFLDFGALALVVPGRVEFQQPRINGLFGFHHPFQQPGPVLFDQSSAIRFLPVVKRRAHGWVDAPNVATDTFVFGYTPRQKLASRTRGQRNHSKKDQDHADAEHQNNERRSPETKRILDAIEAARRAALVIALSGDQAVPRPDDRGQPYQQEQHRPLLNPKLGYKSRFSTPARTHRTSFGFRCHPLALTGGSRRKRARCGAGNVSRLGYHADVHV